MPHFVIDFSHSILAPHQDKLILQRVHEVVCETTLFVESDIKIRINPFVEYSVGNTKSEFLHVFAHIMQGRTLEQRANLSRDVVAVLKEMFPQVVNIAMSVAEFEKDTYCHRNMIDNQKQEIPLTVRV